MSKSSELDQTVKTYLIECMSSEDTASYCELSQAEKIALCYAAFKAESSYTTGRVGEQAAITDWLQGLCSSCSIAFTNYEILKLAEQWGSLEPGASEAAQDKILNNYFGFMSNKLGQLFRGYNVPKPQTKAEAK